jgi:hypothetical protein
MECVFIGRRRVTGPSVIMRPGQDSRVDANFSQGLSLAIHIVVPAENNWISVLADE